MPSADAVRLGLCVGFLGWMALRAGWPRARALAWVLPVLAVLALLAHLDFFRLHQARGPVHYWEFYHYHLGTKYFAELGYTGLYDATVVADAEDDPAHFNPDLTIRSLVDYRHVRRREVLARAAAIKAAFSAERWEAFKGDVAVYRTGGRGTIWRASRVQQDHGYNGSPLVTVVLGTLANGLRLSTLQQLRIFAWFDLVLILGAAALVGRWLGAEQGWLLLFLWGVNPLNDHGYVGGAYLRTLHLVCLALGLAAIQRGRDGATGLAFAAASLLRVYPASMAFALAARDLMSPDRARRLAVHWRRYLGFGVGLLALGATTLAVSSPSGASPWLEFADKLRVHARVPTMNVIGLEYPFLYSRQHDAEAGRALWRAGRGMDWAEEAANTLQERRVAHGLAVGASVLVLGLILRGATDGEAMLAGLAAVFALLHLSHYEWAVLALVPLMLPRDRAAPVELAVLFGGLTVARMVPVLAGVSDRKYMVMSLLVGAYFAWALLSRFRRRSRAPLAAVSA